MNELLRVLGEVHHPNTRREINSDGFNFELNIKFMDTLGMIGKLEYHNTEAETSS